eukprot:GHVR01026875.1.p1 GENE.GHVR01026875.1~~GHVR01026875.1.p1  ORF type:complete len:265 (+),score=52.19 GHVR01026875.1:898-1692(+)
MSLEDRINLDGRQPVVIEDDRINSTDYDKWVEEGLSLNRDYSDYKWNLGDWWNKGHAYGERKAVVDSEDWDGPSYTTCQTAGSVCKDFTSTRRRVVLTFGHHQETQSLPQEEQDKLLDECETEGHSIMRLRQRVKEVKSFLSQGWTQSQMDRRRAIEKGGVALANLSKGDDGLPVDNALVCWAEAEGRDEKITRGTDWGNPFVIGEDGDRDTVIAKYGKYLEMKDGLLQRLKSGELSGKLLVCWCCPDGCHGDTLMKKTKEANK